MTIDVSSIGIKFENFMQAGCRDQGLYLGCARDGIFEIFWSRDFLKILVPGFFGPGISPF